MEVDEIQVRKFQRIGTNGRSSTTTHHNNKIVPPPPHKAEDHHHAAAQYHNHHPDDDEEDGLSVSLVKQRSNGGVGAAAGGTGLDIIGAGARFGGWPSSRIVRVSRASGGKDRHSKVLTSKGLRDRRVRLSVTTAIQFYDLQDRLGYDQPSKAVEWLLQAAKSSISELPSLNPSFPDTPKSDENNKRSSEHSEHGFDESAPAEHVELDGDPNNNYLQQQQQGFSNSKSACSSTSETSKGSGGLSLSRSESRIRARERARERAAEKEKEKDNESHHGPHQNVSPISQNNSSFTELLTAGISSNNHNSNNSPNGGGGGDDDSNLANKSRGGQWSTSPIPMEYLSTRLFGPRGQTSSGFSGNTQLGNNTIPQFADHHHHQNLQHFSFVPENFIPVATSASAGGGSGECAYNLNFSISSTTSGLAGYNRGTLQSNSSQSSSLLHPHYIQRFPSIDGSNLPFFIGTSSAAAAVAAPVDNQHHPQFPAGFDARLQLCYGDSPSAARHSDHKGKGK